MAPRCPLWPCNRLCIFLACLGLYSTMLKVGLLQLAARCVETTSSAVHALDFPSSSFPELRRFTQWDQSSIENKLGRRRSESGSEAPPVRTAASQETEPALHSKRDFISSRQRVLSDEKNPCPSRLPRVSCKGARISQGAPAQNLLVTESSDQLTFSGAVDRVHAVDVSDQDDANVQKADSHLHATLEKHDKTSSAFIQEYVVPLEIGVNADKGSDSAERELHHSPVSPSVAECSSAENSTCSAKVDPQSSAIKGKKIHEGTFSLVSASPPAVAAKRDWIGRAHEEELRRKDPPASGSRAEGRTGERARRLWTALGIPAVYIIALHNAFLLRTTEEGRAIQRAAEEEAQQWVKELREKFLKDLFHDPADGDNDTAT